MSNIEVEVTENSETQQPPQVSASEAEAEAVEPEPAKAETAEMDAKEAGGDAETAEVNNEVSEVNDETGNVHVETVDVMEKDVEIDQVPSEPRQSQGAPKQDTAEAVRSQRGFTAFRTESQAAGTILNVQTLKDSPIYVVDKFAESDDFHDPSKPLPAIDPNFVYDPERIKGWVQTLSAERLLLLSCHDSDLLACISYELGKHLDVSLDKRFIDLDFEAKNSKRILSFSDLCDKVVEQRPPCLIMVVASTHAGESFVETMPGPGPTLTSIKKRLVDLKSYVLLVGADDILPSSEAYRGLRDNVDFLEYRLARTYPDKHKEYQEKIRQQRIRRKWAEDEKSFCEEVVSHVISRTLPREIEERESQATVDTSALLTAEDDLLESVLFVATFFKDLSAQDFNRVLLRLLGDDVTTEKGVSYFMREDGEAGVEEISQDKRLEEIWNKDHRRILKECHLVFRQPIAGAILSETPAGGGMREPLVDFVASGLREDLHQTFWGSAHMTYLKLFQRVYDEALLFDPSMEVMEAVIWMMVEMAGGNPQRYGRQWLIDLVLKAGRDRPLDSGQEESEAQRLRFIIDRMHRNFFYHRMERLIRAMLKDSRLRESIDHFFTRLISMGFYHEVCELVWRLRFVADLDAFHWWKVLIERGDQSIYVRVLNGIIATAYEGSAHLADVTRRAGEWLESAGSASSQGLSGPASHLIIELCLNMTFRRSRRVIWRWPPENKVLAAFAAAPDAELERKILVGLSRHENQIYLAQRWPEHLGLFLALCLVPEDVCALLPDHGESLRQELAIKWIRTLHKSRETDQLPEQGEFFPCLLEALILADWAMELLGFEETVPEQAVALWSRLTSAVSNGFDRRGKKILSHYWSTITHCQVEILRGLNQASGQIPQDQRKELLRVRRRISRDKASVRRLRKEGCSR